MFGFFMVMHFDLTPVARSREHNAPDATSTAQKEWPKAPAVVRLQCLQAPWWPCLKIWNVNECGWMWLGLPRYPSDPLPEKELLCSKLLDAEDPQDQLWAVHVPASQGGKTAALEAKCRVILSSGAKSSPRNLFLSCRHKHDSSKFLQFHSKETPSTLAVSLATYALPRVCCS